MRIIIILSFLILVPQIVFCQITEKQNNKIRFRVSKVKLADNLLPEVDYKTAIEICLDAEIGF